MTASGKFLDVSGLAVEIERKQWSMALSRSDDIPEPVPETGAASGGKRPGARRQGQPGWAEGLRKLYDSVVEEPLPDSFNELLKKLDQAGGA